MHSQKPIVAYLVLRNHPILKDKLPLFEGQNIVGRVSEKSTVVIKDAQISSCHAKITINKNKMVLTDLGSKNGTFLDEDSKQRIDKGKEFQINDGQFVAFGQVECNIQIAQQSKKTAIQSKAAKQALNKKTNVFMELESLTEKQSKIDKKKNQSQDSSKIDSNNIDKKTKKQTSKGQNTKKQPLKILQNKNEYSDISDESDIDVPLKKSTEVENKKEKQRKQKLSKQRQEKEKKQKKQKQLKQKKAKDLKEKKQKEELQKKQRLSKQRKQKQQNQCKQQQQKQEIQRKQKEQRLRIEKQMKKKQQQERKNKIDTKKQQSKKQLKILEEVKKNLDHNVDKQRNSKSNSKQKSETSLSSLKSSEQSISKKKDKSKSSKAKNLKKGKSQKDLKKSQKDKGEQKKGTKTLLNVEKKGQNKSEIKSKQKSNKSQQSKQKPSKPEIKTKNRKKLPIQDSEEYPLEQKRGYRLRQRLLKVTKYKISGNPITYHPFPMLKLAQDDDEEYDVLVMDGFIRTYKLLFSISRGIPVMKKSWLVDSQLYKKAVDFDYHWLQYPGDKTLIKDSVNKVKEGFLLFKDMEFYIASKTDNLSIDYKKLERLVYNGGGSVIMFSSKLKSDKNYAKRIYILLDKDYTDDELEKAKQINKDNIYNVELVFDCTLTQKLDLKKHKISL